MVADGAYVRSGLLWRAAKALAMEESNKKKKNMHKSKKRLGP